jgi:hypothetical protein
MNPNEDEPLSHDRHITPPEVGITLQSREPYISSIVSETQPSEPDTDLNFSPMSSASMPPTRRRCCPQGFRQSSSWKPWHKEFTLTPREVLLSKDAAFLYYLFKITMSLQLCCLYFFASFFLHFWFSQMFQQNTWSPLMLFQYFIWLLVSSFLVLA